MLHEKAFIGMVRSLGAHLRQTVEACEAVAPLFPLEKEEVFPFFYLLFWFCPWCGVCFDI